MQKEFEQSSKTGNPLEVAQQSVQKTLDLAEQGHSVVLAMGEHHSIFSHQVSQALALKEFAARQQDVTLFMEYPHNRLYTILLDRGYGTDNALKLAQHITAYDTEGHITAKAIIGGNKESLSGKTHFHAFESQLLLQAAIHHGIKIVCADAARVYPADFCMDYSDHFTDEIASKLNARRGNAGECGPDDMLIRNTFMAQTIKAELDKNGGVALLPTGAAHCFGIEDEGNGLHHYKDSLVKRFEEMELPSVMTSMLPDESLPSDYESPAGEQMHLFDKPGPLTLIDDMSDSDIHDFLTKHDLDPEIYDPRQFEKSYRAEFDSILKQAEIELDVQTPLQKPVVRTSANLTL